MAKAPTGDEPEITDAELAALSGFTTRRIRQLAQENVIPSVTSKAYPRDAAITALFTHVRAKARIDEERHLKLKEERQRLERERQIEEGKLLTLDQWNALLGTLVPPIREWVRALLKSSLPANCQGKDEPALRAWGNEKYDAFNAHMRAIDIPDVPGVAIPPEPL